MLVSAAATVAVVSDLLLFSGGGDTLARIMTKIMTKNMPIAAIASVKPLGIFVFFVFLFFFFKTE